MARNSKKLEKLLDAQQTIEAEGRVFNDEVFQKVKNALVEWGGKELENYNPIVELAKIANDPSIDDSLKARCNMEIASYMYPKVKSYEIKSKEDKTINVNIRIAPYAQKKKDVEIEAEDINDIEDEEEKDPGKIDYTEMVLSHKNPNKFTN